VRGGGRQAGSTHSAGSRQTYSSTLDGSHVHNSNSPAQHSTAQHTIYRRQQQRTDPNQRDQQTPYKLN